MPRSVRFDNGKALVPLCLIAERWIRDYWQLASGPRMPRQIHQNRELGFGTALERTMTKCHSPLLSKLKCGMETVVLRGRGLLWAQFGTV